MESIKIDEYSIEITTTVPTPAPIKRVYERSFIESQIEQITKQRDSLIAIKEAELKECTDILAEMNKLDIVAKPVEEATQPIELKDL